MHTSTHIVLYMTGEKRAGHDHLSATFPSYRQTEGALEIPLATPAQPKVAHLVTLYSRPGGRDERVTEVGALFHISG